MLQIVVHLFVNPGQHAAFHEFESAALGILASHGGHLSVAFRPDGAGQGDVPDEIHVLQLPDRAAFAAYRADPRLLALAGLRSVAIARTVTYLGDRCIDYPSRSDDSAK